MPMLIFCIQVCFAYKGSLPRLRVRASFDEVDPDTNIILSSGFRNIRIE